MKSSHHFVFFSSKKYLFNAFTVFIIKIKNDIGIYALPRIRRNVECALLVRCGQLAEPLENILAPVDSMCGGELSSKKMPIILQGDVQIIQSSPATRPCMSSWQSGMRMRQHSTNTAYLKRSDKTNLAELRPYFIHGHGMMPRFVSAIFWVNLSPD